MYVWYLGQLKFNISVRCDMAFIVSMHRDKPSITYLLHPTHRAPINIHYFKQIMAFNNMRTYLLLIQTLVSAVKVRA